MATQSYFAPGGLALKLAKALEIAGMTPDEMNALAEDKKCLGDIVNLRRGIYMLVPTHATQPSPEPALDFIIRVDRSVKPNYPDWGEMRLVHPELELAGPHEYNLQTEVELWPYDGQKRESFGSAIYKRLLKDGILTTCLNLQDGYAIQSKGIAVFRKSLFVNRVVPLWGSVVEDHDGDLFVACLDTRRGKVVLPWHEVSGVFENAVFVHKSSRG